MANTLSRKTTKWKKKKSDSCFFTSAAGTSEKLSLNRVLRKQQFHSTTPFKNLGLELDFNQSTNTLALHYEFSISIFTCGKMKENLFAIDETTHYRHKGCNDDDVPYSNG